MYLLCEWTLYVIAIIVFFLLGRAIWKDIDDTKLLPETKRAKAHQAKLLEYGSLIAGSLIIYVVLKTCFPTQLSNIYYFLQTHTPTPRVTGVGPAIEQIPNAPDILKGLK